MRSKKMKVYTCWECGKEEHIKPLMYECDKGHLLCVKCAEKTYDVQDIREDGTIKTRECPACITEALANVDREGARHGCPLCNGKALLDVQERGHESYICVDCFFHWDLYTEAFRIRSNDFEHDFVKEK